MWAYTSALTTMTGRVGLTDNSSAAFYYASKPVAIAAGETYVYTFVNNNAGSGNFYENWILEGNDGTYYFDFRPDGGYWGGIFDNNLATNSYSGNTYTDISSDASTWQAAYNGVTVTVTATRSNDGATLTFTHSATTNTSVAYSGTFTVTLTNASSTINIYFTNEKSYQDITKVVYTKSDGGAVYVAPDHTAGAQWGSNKGASTVDAEKEHYNNDASSAWAGCAYAKFSYADLPDGVTITDATVTYSINQGGSRAREDKIFYMNKDFDLDWANFAGKTGTDLRNTNSRSTSAVGTVSTGGTGNRLNLSLAVTSAVSTMYSAGQEYILLQWTGNAGGADLYGKTSAYAPSLGITYATIPVYTATFTEANSLSPTVTIYSDSERTAEVTNGTLTDATTYYYTATLEGYEDYEGSFTVASADPAVEFTMTQLSRYTFTVNAVNSVGGAVIQAFLTDTDSYDGKSQSATFPKYLTDENNLVTYVKDDNTYGANYTSDSENATISISYTAYEGVAYLYEGESYGNLGTKMASWYYSNGSAGRGLNNGTIDIVTIPTTGTYNLSYAACSNHTGSARTYSFYKNNSDNVVETQSCQWSVNYVRSTGTKTVSDITFSSGDVLQFYAGDTQIVLDYVLLELESVSASISDAGWATLYTPYALDFSTLSSSFTAYTASLDESTVTLTSVSNVPANTGVVLKGTAGSYNIPVAASSSTAQGDLQGNASAATAFDGVTGYDLYMLAMNGDEAQFTKVTSGTIAAGKAYLPVAQGSDVKAFNVVFNDTATAVNEMSSKAAAEDVVIYNLAGQRMSKVQKGINIINGKKFIVK